MRQLYDLGLVEPCLQGLLAIDFVITAHTHTFQCLRRLLGSERKITSVFCLPKIVGYTAIQASSW